VFQAQFDGLRNGIRERIAVGRSRSERPGDEGA
jgi:hypothetical protein